MSTPSSIRIDQVFHGYDRGHREIASSVRLDEESRATMLIYSDLLSDLGDGTESSYLACYPLPSASRHVLARTWSAGAGYRPGSVWTHSLVLDYQTLALFTDLVALEPMLMNTGNVERGRQVRPLLVRTDITADGLPELGSNAAIAVQRLYGQSEGSVAVPTRGRRNDGLLALVLWRQMWPRLRREFSFVTSIDAGSPDAGSDWMLRFSKIEPQDVDLERGLKVLLDDLPVPGQTPLRLFLNRYAVEAPTSRRIAGRLAKLWAMPEVGFEERLRAVRELTDNVPLPRLTRDLISAELDTSVEPSALLAIVSEFGDQPLDADPSRILLMSEAMDDGTFRRLLVAAAGSPPDRLGGRIFDTIVGRGDLHRLVNVSSAVDRAAMLRFRPQLLDVADFWPDNDLERASLIAGYSGDLDLDKGWELFGSAIGPHTFEAFLHRSSDAPLPVLLKLLVDGEASVTRLAATLLLSIPSLFETVLENEDVRIIGHLADAQIASARPPSNPSAWCAAIRRGGGGSVAPSVLVTCCCASLMLGGDDGLAAAREIYDPLQQLIRKYRLSNDQEHYLESALSKSISSWSLTDRLMKSTLLVWLPEKKNAGALTISREYYYFRDLVDETFNRLGKLKLKETLIDPNLPPEVRIYIERKLEDPGKKSWWW